MLHAKFQDRWTFCSEEEYLKDFTIYGRGFYHLCNFVPLHKEALRKIWLLLVKRIKRKVLKNNGHKHLYSQGGRADVRLFSET